MGNIVLVPVVVWLVPVVADSFVMVAADIPELVAAGIPELVAADIPELVAAGIPELVAADIPELVVADSFDLGAVGTHVAVPAHNHGMEVAGNLIVLHTVG